MNKCHKFLSKHSNDNITFIVERIVGIIKGEEIANSM